MISKYDSMKFWKEMVAGTLKRCQKCYKPINIGDVYYRERLTDPKINFIGKLFCSNCYKNQINKKNK